MKFTYLFLVILLLSCVKNKELIEDKLKGQWSIDEIEYKDLNYKDYLLSNVLVLNDNYNISIPETFHFEKEEFSFWNLNSSNNNILEIECDNQVFKGRFDVKFFKNKEKKLLGIILKSDSTYIKAHKFLQNYDNLKGW